MEVYRKVGEILLELEEYVSVKIITTEDYNNIKNTNFISNVKKEGIILGGI
jgi:hypothetical protein